MMSRMLCLFYTEDMFTLIQMRKNLKKKIIGIVDKIVPDHSINLNGKHA